MGTIAHFPIRAMDYDEKNQMLFTGDEMGYMNKWDISRLNEKLDELVAPKDQQKQSSDQNSFPLTGVNTSTKIKFSAEDVVN